MTTFKDPLGQYSFSLPLGWAYSARRSHLITVTFVRAGRIEERICVRAVPTYASEGTDAQWRADARKSAFRPDLVVRDCTLGPKIVLFADVPAEDDEGAFAQAAVVRGRHIDVVIRHENPTEATGEKLTSDLSTLVRTLVIPTDLSPPLEIADQNLVYERLQQAFDSAGAEKWDEAARSASDARVLARDTYLKSAHGGALFPEVPAVVALIDALLLQFRVTANVGLTRDAELLIERAAFTLRELPLISAARKDQVMGGLRDRGTEIERVQREVIESIWPDAPSGRRPSAARRQEFLMRNAFVAFERGDVDEALASAETTVDDLLMLQANVLESLAAAADDEPVFAKDDVELTPDAAAAVLGRYLEGELADALRTLSTLHRSLGELDAARAANALLIDLSRRLSKRAPTPRGHIEPREGQRQHLAAAVLDQLASHVLFGSERDQDVAWQLDQAQLLLEELKEGADLRSRERFLRRVWAEMQGHDLDLRFDQTPWVRRRAVSALPEDELRTLVDWALMPAGPTSAEAPPAAVVPPEVLGKGPAAIIAHVEKLEPDHEAVRYWRATGADAPKEGLHHADGIAGGWLGEDDWRRGWAIAALRALDATLPLAHPGLLTGLEFARACLLQPRTLFPGDAAVAIGDRAPTFDTSPFGDAVVRRVLSSLDALVALQELQPTRFEDVLSDLATAGHPDFGRAKAYLDGLPAGVVFRNAIGSDGVGGAIGLLLRAGLTEAERRSDLGTVESLSSATIRLAARYGCTGDFLLAAHRVAAGTDRWAPTAEVLSVVEHLRLAALWLGDADLEATTQHAIGLMLRQGTLRGVAGVVEAIPAFQRAATLYDQLGDSVSAAGALTDLAALLIGYREQLENTEEGRDWPAFARRYLVEAMARLVRRAEHPNSVTYLGEAYQNLARLHLDRDQAASREAALRCVALATSIGFDDLIGRGSETLELATGEAESLVKTALPSADAVLESTRADVEEELGEFKLFSSRAGLLNAILDSLFDQAARSIDEARATELLLRQVEADRGFTYKRWLSAAEPVGMRRLADELAGDATRPVLAVYLVTRSGVGLIVLDGDEPARLERIDLTASDADQLVAEHLAALAKHRRTCGRLPWQKFQERFVSDGAKLVAPLERHVEDGRTICLIPHGVLHGAALHTLPCAPGGAPIGLRTPVFVNPSVTNWLAARHGVSESAGALVAATCPADQVSEFAEGDRIAALLSLEVNGEIVRPAPEATDLDSLGSEPPYQVLHLASHGMFDSDSMEMGLLMSRDGELPPPPPRGSDPAARRFLVRPNEIHRQGCGAKLVFLGSCVSSRNAEYPGDDLMGLTRAFFGSGTSDLVAGAWTVISEFVGPFTDRFYAELVDGRSVAEAMLSARRCVAETHSSPFLWGAFQHQGANINPLLDHAE